MNCRVKNKYNLTVSKIKQLKVGDRSKMQEPTLYRNDGMGAWFKCAVIGSMEFDNTIYIKIFDDDTVDIRFTAYGDMCGYNFEEFYDPESIENDIDLETHARTLEIVHELINKGILLLEDEG